ncbi:hypothetical protein [Microseira sp. BLCC-F43]|uniref:hypothetical protein n=1 Tax=Microseira sp. BLCC-F43 TaxID=3153602 RepID=UPI0035BB225B
MALFPSEGYRIGQETPLNSRGIPINTSLTGRCEAPAYLAEKIRILISLWHPQPQDRIIRQPF